MNQKALGFSFVVLVSLGSSLVARADDTLEVTAPGAPWILRIPKGGLAIQSEKVSPDGKKSYVMMADEKAGLNLSFFVEPVDKCHTSRECRDLVQKGGFAHLGNASDVRAAEIGEVSVVECFVPEFKGVPVKQGHMFAEFVADGYWVDAHLSKVLYTSTDRKLFEDTVKSVSFVPKTAKP